MKDEQIRKEIPKLCENHGFPFTADIPITISQDLIKIGQYEDNPIFYELTKCFKNHTQTQEVYRFMKTEYALKTLEKRKLFSFNLLSQYDNDYGEAIEFLSRSGVCKLLAPQQTRIDETTVIYREIDQEKDCIHTLCFSKKPTERMWNEYADDKKGCCLVFKATYEPAFHTRFSDIVYESDDLDNLFTKINLLQKEIRRKYERELYIPSIPYFMCLYKRKSYKWEDEIRFFFKPNKLNYKLHVNCMEEKKFGYSVKKKYCLIPFSEKSDIPLYLDLTNVLIGEKVSSSDRAKIEDNKDKILANHH